MSDLKHMFVDVVLKIVSYIDIDLYHISVSPTGTSVSHEHMLAFENSLSTLTYISNKLSLWLEFNSRHSFTIMMRRKIYL